MRSHSASMLLATTALACGRELPPIFLEYNSSTIASICPAETSLPDTAKQFTIDEAASAARLVDASGTKTTFVVGGDFASVTDGCGADPCRTRIVALRICAYRGQCSPGGDYVAITSCGPISAEETSTGAGLTQQSSRFAIRKGTAGSNIIESKVFVLPIPIAFRRTVDTFAASSSVLLSDTGTAIDWNIAGNAQ